MRVEAETLDPRPVFEVLYAEDDPLDADLTCTHFAEYAPEFRIEVAGTGQACLDRLRESAFDLLLLDHHLPDMDGLDVLKEVVRTSAPVPVVLITGVGYEALVVKALRLGAANYVPKQGNYRELLPDLLRGVIDEQRRRQRQGLSATASPRRILYVDHHQTDIDLSLQHFAETSPHFTVEVARTCTEALDRLAQPPACDLALIDLRMPDLSGLDFVREAKLRRLALPPFIMISGQGDDAAAIATLKLGAADYVVKRAGYLNQLTYCIDNAIERDRLNRLNEQLRLELAERKRVEEQLAASEAQLHAIFDAAPSCIKLIRADGSLLQINAAGVDMFEAESAAAVVGRPIFELIAPEHRERYQALIERAAHGGRGRMDLELVGLRGGRRSAETHAVPFLNAATNGSRLIVAVTRDVSEQKRAEHELLQLAHYDTLTGLPNRLLFNDRLQQAMEYAQRHERLVGVAMLDIDQFKKVNDSLGHPAGDALLQQVGARLRAALRPNDTVARLGGDEFTVVLADMAEVDDATVVLQKVLQSFETPFRVDGRELFITASIGVTLFPFDDQDAQALLRNADVAMYRAKESGRNAWQFYAAEMTAKVSENLAIETELRGAIERGELALHYQPQLNLASGRITGVEALLRWRNGLLGDVAPDRFIPIAEESGLIVPIGDWVLRTACAQAQRWRAAGFGALRMAVNLSARQCRDADFYDKVRRVLADSAMPPEALELEVTESLLLEKTGGSAAALERLDALGVRFAVDDFGTGYSSLSYLKRLPIDVLKIDRSFVRDIATDADDAAIVRAIITLAGTLGIEVVAEGVETQEQQEFLRQHGCDALQGYHFCRPGPAQAITPLLEDRLDPGSSRFAPSGPAPA